jgi:hypothetical protein
VGDDETRSITGRQRREPRLATELEGTLSGRHDRGVWVLDLSLRGCLVRSVVGFDKGAILALKVGLGDDDLEATARVAECSLDGERPPDAEALYLVGLEFMNLSAESTVCLRRYLDSERKR